MLDCKPMNTAIVVNHGLQITEGSQLADQKQYEKIVRKVDLSFSYPS